MLRETNFLNIIFICSLNYDIFSSVLKCILKEQPKILAETFLAL
jgi:hypothetical protein